MYNVEDILNLMEGGKSTEEIATEFAEALNEAIKVNKSKEDEAQREKEKYAAAVKIADDINNFMHTFYGDAVDADENISAEDIINTTEQIINMEKKVNEWAEKLKTPRTVTFKNGSLLNNSKPEVERAVKAVIDPIAKFLEEYGL